MYICVNKSGIAVGDGDTDVHFSCGVSFDLLNSNDGADHERQRLARFPGCLAWSGLRIPARCRHRCGEDPAAREEAESVADELLLVFKDREELLDRLVSRWREKNTGNLVRQSEAYAETIAEAMLNVFDCWLDGSLFDSQFEFAVRSWALQSPEILAEVQSADQQRLDALTRMFLRFGHDEARADVRARTIYLVQIGYISMQTKEDVSVRMKRIPEYVEIFTGQVPEQRELDRFFARHGYSG